MMAIAVFILFALSRDGMENVTVAEGLQVSLIVLFLLACAFATRRTAVSLTGEGITVRSSIWLSRQKKLRYEQITGIYEVLFLLQKYYVIEGQARSKTEKIQIGSQIKDWQDILRRIVSKVDPGIVDHGILQFLGVEVSAAGRTVKGTREKRFLPFHHVSWLFRNLVILVFVTLLNTWISNRLDPGFGISTIAIYLVSWIIAFFFIAYLTPVKKWMHLVLAATVFLVMSWHFEVPITWNICVLVFSAMIIGGGLSSRFIKFMS